MCNNLAQKDTLQEGRGNYFTSFYQKKIIGK